MTGGVVGQKSISIPHIFESFHAKLRYIWPKSLRENLSHICGRLTGLRYRLKHEPGRFNLITWTKFVGTAVVGIAAVGTEAVGIAVASHAVQCCVNNAMFVFINNY